jgi:hypothetical protein
MAQKFPKHHGILLAANSWIENLHVERLDADPLPISASRIWYNLTERCLKYSSLDAQGAITIEKIGDQTALNTAIAALQAALTQEATDRDVADQAEIAARISAINALQASLDAAIAAQTAALAQEVSDRAAAVAAEAVLRVDGDAVTAATASDQLATETTARLAGDAAQTTRSDAIQAELDRSQAGAGLNVDGTYTAPENTTTLGDSVSLKDAAVKLDAALAVEAATRMGQVAGLASALANETQLREDGDATLAAQLRAYIDGKIGDDEVQDQAEVAARIAADAALQAELDQTQAAIGLDTQGRIIPISGTNYLNEVTTVFGGAFVLDAQIKRVDDAVVAEVAARTTANDTLQAALDAEKANREAKDASLQQELNTTQAGAGLETDGSYASPTGSNYLNTAQSLKDADYVLDAALKAVSDRVDVSAGDIAGLTTDMAEAKTDISTLKTRMGTAEGDIDVLEGRAGAIESAATALESRVDAAEAAIAQEVTDRNAAVSSVSAAVVTEKNRAIAVEDALDSRIDTLEASAGAGANALKGQLDGRIVRFKSVAPALEHTVTHNFGEFYQLSVMVKDAGGVFRNDIVPIEEIDANSVKISLTEARDIKVVVQSMAALS